MRAILNGVSLTWEESGQGRPVVLIHGFPLDRSMWRAQAAALAGRARLILPDLRGFGESPPGPGAASMDVFADDVRALLDHLQIPRAVVGGLSMGGYVAFAFQRKYPDRVQALLLCDTKAASDTPQARAGRADMIEHVRARGTASIADLMLPRLLAPATLERRADVAVHVRQMILRASPAGVIAALQAMADRPDAGPGLPDIRCPVLFVVGARDAVSPPEEAAAICSCIPGARRVVVDDAGHLAPMENPDPVNTAVAEFLDALNLQPGT